MHGLAERNCYEATRNCVFERLGTVVCTNRTFSNYRRGQVGRVLSVPLVFRAIFYVWCGKGTSGSVCG
jgi:hypothetical protein